LGEQNPYSEAQGENLFHGLWRSWLNSLIKVFRMTKVGTYREFLNYQVIKFTIQMKLCFDGCPKENIRA
jgi:hypothetical protein